MKKVVQSRLFSGFSPCFGKSEICPNMVIFWVNPISWFLVNASRLDLPAYRASYGSLCCLRIHHWCGYGHTRINTNATPIATIKRQTLFVTVEQLILSTFLKRNLAVRPTYTKRAAARSSLLLSCLLTLSEVKGAIESNYPIYGLLLIWTSTKVHIQARDDVSASAREHT